jgi:ribonuclease HI
MEPEILLFTDGACSGNPGKGGWAYLLRESATGAERTASAGERSTTNNRMELTSVIRGLASLPARRKVRVVTDSQYVSKGATEWLPGWKSRGWRRKVGTKLEPVANEDLWRELDSLLAQHEVEFRWIRGHAGHAENEACDRLAVAAYQNL